MFQWIRIHVPMQGTYIQSLVQEDATEQLSLDVMITEAHVTRAREPQLLSPHAVTTEARSP